MLFGGIWHGLFVLILLSIFSYALVRPPINKNKLPKGDSFILTASLMPTPNIKIGIMNGMINIGSKIFHLFAPKVRAEPIIPISLSLIHI